LHVDLATKDLLGLFPFGSIIKDVLTAALTASLAI